MQIKEKAERINSEISAVFIAMKRDDTPLYAKLMAGMCVVYALSPIDLIPDFIPILGYLDDLLILPAMLYLTIKMIPTEIYEECVVQSEDAFKEGGEKKLVYAIPVIIIWAIIIISIIRAVLNGLH